MTDILTHEDMLNFYQDRIPINDLERMVGLVFQWDTFEEDRQLTATEFGQLALDVWLRWKTPFTEVQRHTILKLLGESKRFCSVCESWSLEAPDCFVGCLVSWFDDRWMGITGNDGEVYDLQLGRWINANEKPQHAWILIVEIVAIYRVSLNDVKEKTDARDSARQQEAANRSA